MPAYPVTARAAINAAGFDLDPMLDAIAAGQTALRACPELGVPPLVAGWLGPIAALPEPFGGFDGRATRVLWPALARIRESVDIACQRWGAARVGAVIAVPPADLDALALAIQLERSPTPPPAELVTELVRAATQARGPIYGRCSTGAGGASAVAAGVRLLDAHLLDAVVVGGCDALGPGAGRRTQSPAAGEGAALALLERHGDGFVEIVGVAESVRGSAALLLSREHAGVWPQVGYVHAIDPSGSDPARPEAPLTTTVAITGHLGAAAGATELVVALVGLERGRLCAQWSGSGSPAPLEVEAALVDVPCGRGGRAAILLRARSS